MTGSNKYWKKGRGKLGVFAPLIGNWIAQSSSSMGSVTCMRNFTEILEKTHIQLIAKWEFGDKIYTEHAIIGVDKDKQISFWSFTSDGKNSYGKLADVSDIHPDAIGFEANMDAGLARMVYWPDEDNGFYWIVENKTKKGWNRFVEHHYKRMED